LEFSHSPDTAGSDEGPSSAKNEFGPPCDPYAYSVKLVDKTENGKAGNVAKLFYVYYRVLDPGFDVNNHPRNWDDFYTQIL
jgi:hypothetical protein